MEQNDNLLVDAIDRRISAWKREVFLHFSLGFVVGTLGVVLLILIWLYYRTDETELAKAGVSLGMGMITGGFGGYLFKTAMDYRKQISIGEDWLLTYNDARTPPPDELLEQIETRILSWLEGTQ